MATTPPLGKLTFEATGIGAPHGHTVKKPACEGSTAVTFIATAVASAGMLSEMPSDRAMAAPTSGIVMVPPAGIRTFGTPIALRVSTTRRGVAPTNVGDATDGASEPAGDVDEEVGLLIRVEADPAARSDGRDDAVRDRPANGEVHVRCVGPGDVARPHRDEPRLRRE